MVEYLKELVSTNPTFSAIFSGGLVATLVLHSKLIFYFITGNLHRLISFKIQSVTRNIGWGDDKVSDLEILLSTKTPLFQKDFELKSGGIIGVGFGSSWYILYGKLISVNKNIETSNGTMFLKTNIYVYFASKKRFLKRLSQDLKVASNKFENKTSISFKGYTIKKEKRPLKTIYTNDNLGFEVFKDVKNFINSKKFYIENNIPYKRNYLLYGKPGTGKTSLIFSIASELNYNIKIIDLGCFNNIDSLLYEIYYEGNNTIFVFEDIDAMGNKLENRKEYVKKNEPIEINAEVNLEMEAAPESTAKEINLSLLLNLLDGLYTKDGMISIFTTNHVEKLDEAFLRDGRMDYKIEMTDLNPETAHRMIYEKTGLLLKIEKDINPATLQEWIIKYKNRIITQDEFVEGITKNS